MALFGTCTCCQKAEFWEIMKRNCSCTYSIYILRLISDTTIFQYRPMLTYRGIPQKVQWYTIAQALHKQFLKFFQRQTFLCVQKSALVQNEQTLLIRSKMPEKLTWRSTLLTTYSRKYFTNIHNSPTLYSQITGK